MLSTYWSRSSLARLVLQLPRSRSIDLQPHPFPQPRNCPHQISHSHRIASLLYDRCITMVSDSKRHIRRLNLAGSHLTVLCRNLPAQLMFTKLSTPQTRSASLNSTPANPGRHYDATFPKFEEVRLSSTKHYRMPGERQSSHTP